MEHYSNISIKDSIQIKLVNFQTALKDCEASIRYNKDNSVFKTVLPLLDNLLYAAEKSYTSNRKIIQNIIGYLTDSTSVGKSLLLYRLCTRFFTNQEVLCVLETPDYMVEIPEDKKELTTELYKSILQSFPQKVDITQISEMAVAHLGEEESMWLQSLCGRYIANYGTILGIDEQSVFSCSILRPLTIRNKQREYFFYVMTQLVSCLSRSHYYQEARDYAESAILLGFEDNIEEYGFLVATRAYTSNNDAIAGLVYYNMLMDIIHQKNSVTKKFLFEVLWQQVMTLRTSSFFKQDYYKLLSDFFDKHNFCDYDYDSFYHSLFGI